MKDRLEKYNIVLTRLTEDKIELVRRWRNDPKISQYMEFRQKITSEMQKKWFFSINNDYNLYFIIVFKGEEIGLINIKNIDVQTKSGESGVFIYEDNYLNSDISYRAHLCLFDYYFEELGYNEVHSHILSSNKRAIRFSEFLGSQKVGDTEYSLLKSDYESNLNRQRFINKYNKLKNKTND